ncbi:MAG: PEP-CTERM sorting domain-containing protein [Rhodospirillaceae bacterium]|jgi:hypothetical protein|nr:PEP-CTERM sorting domain-containing protein [Rhodospirillaceae bacterium]MBT5665697.1 PEP-CTERM sorting domain-containing protein [Rhodospirillaceae bacterium]MBT5810857.1 PEP-CTERM sorting domain-containing protein [Rhodospirillaceae bacterium]
MHRILTLIGLAGFLLVTTSAPSKAVLTTYNFTGHFSGFVTFDLIGDDAFKSATALQLTTPLLPGFVHDQAFLFDFIDGSAGPEFLSVDLTNVILDNGPVTAINDSNFAFEGTVFTGTEEINNLAGGLTLALVNVNEPSQIVLVGLGLAGFFAMRRRQKLRQA